MGEEQRNKYEESLKAQQIKHNKHEKLHHPGNKAQLEEVWKEQDHMDPSDFNPKQLFMMHGMIVYLMAVRFLKERCNKMCAYIVYRH